MNIHDFIKVPESHKQTIEYGIYNVTTETFNKELHRFLTRFSEIQQKEQNYRLPFHLYEQFPFVDIKELASETFTRKQDLHILEKHFQKYLTSNNTVLEIGGWNGWLTHFMSNAGLQVVSSDIFIDERNGLKSKIHYKQNNWLSIQTDLLDSRIYHAKFDIIIFNHCLQFLTDPMKLIEQYKLLLNNNGILLILGNTFYRNTDNKKSEILKANQYFKEKYDFNIRFYPSKGYFSSKDFDSFLKSQFKYLPYNFSIPGRLRKVWKGEKSGILYFVKPNITVAT